MRTRMNLALAVICFTGSLSAQKQIEQPSAYVCDTIYIDDNDTLHWTTRGEQESMPFLIEQYLWGKWRTMGEIPGNGKATLQKYKFPIGYVNGLNRFRINQISWEFVYSDIQPYPNFTQETTKEVKLKKVKMTFENRVITFSQSTTYALLMEGLPSELLKGRGKTIDLSHYDPCTLIIRYSDGLEEIVLE